MIVILCGAGIGFPNGTAPTARVTAYARGLTLHGAHVLVLCLGTTEFPDIGVFNHAVRGEIDGVQFEYTCGATVRGATFLQRRWLTFKGRMVAAWRIITLSRNQPIEALLLYPDTWMTAIWFWLVARVCNAAYLLEKSEQPFLEADRSRLRRWYAAAYMHTIYKLFDGGIVISEHLRQTMARYIRKGARLLKIPILVDADEFAPAANTTSHARYIAYCGTLNEAKDGVHTLLRSFSRISAEFADVNLMLIGDSYKASEIPRFRQYAEELGVLDRVTFTGVVARPDMPKYLAHATALALARPSSKQATAGFPTKLGEYLASGNPVVVTRTGEIADYLEDGISAYLVPPDDVDEFTRALRHVLSHAQEAQAVGQQGRRVAEQSFDYRRNAQLILGFIQQLRNDHAR